MRVLYQPHGDLFGARALSGKRFSGGSSFFVYAYHGMPLALAIKVVVRYLPPGSELEVIGLYLGSACVVIGIGLALYGGMRRCVPSFLLLITGGR
mgnify:CR=1 FL=1